MKQSLEAKVRIRHWCHKPAYTDFIFLIRYVNMQKQIEYVVFHCSSTSFTRVQLHKIINWVWSRKNGAAIQNWPPRLWCKHIYKRLWEITAGNQLNVHRTLHLTSWMLFNKMKQNVSYEIFLKKKFRRIYPCNNFSCELWRKTVVNNIQHIVSTLIKTCHTTNCQVFGPFYTE